MLGKKETASFDTPSRERWLPPIDRLRAVFFVLLTAVLIGCNSVDIAEDLTQTQANEIVSLLNSKGIASVAQKETGGKARYSVEVKRSFYSQAVSLLAEKGLPSEHKETFSEISASHGLLPNSREMEALRLDHALAIELEETLQNHPSVASAKVMARLHFLKDNAPAGVSVVIQERAGAKLDPDEIVQIVLRGVPGIKKESIYISTHLPPEDNIVNSNDGVFNAKGRVIRVPLVPFLLAWRVPEDDYSGLALTLSGCIVLVALVGALVGYWYGYFQQTKRIFETDLPDLSPRSGRLEKLTDRSRRDLPEA